MNKPELSEHFKKREPSAIRVTQIVFATRKDKVTAINTAIGNVSLPMHPAMQKRMLNLGAADGPFKNGVVKYSTTVGFEETQKAFLNIIASSGFRTDGLHAQITDGGSQAMELVIVGVCGAAGSTEKPMMLIDPAYTNYKAFAERVGRATVSITRHLQENGKFTLPEMDEIENVIRRHQPGGMIVIPYDNPTGQFYDRATMIELGKLCAKYNIWMISDEAYRELYYVQSEIVSIWGLTDKEVPGIEGRRISIETASKVWNACGLRMGAIITDNKEFHDKAVAESTANLCPNVIGQYIFGALAHEKHEDLHKWYDQQRKYYKPMMSDFAADLSRRLPGVIISSPDSSLYTVVDMRKAAKAGFDARDFVLYCAKQGKVKLDGQDFTTLVSPMAEFYNINAGQENPGTTQMRIAYVVSPDEMKKVAYLFAELFKQYEAERN